VLATGTAVFTWTVVAPVVTVSSPGNQSSILNEVISLHITATDSAGAGYTFTAAGLPTGLSISLAGLITGTCTAAAVFSTTITATDTHGITGAAAITWTVAAVTVTVVQPIDQINNVGDTVSLPVTAIDSSDNTLTWSAANLPFPLIINPTTGLITGSPQTPGIYTVVVTAFDATASVTGTTGFNWTIDVSTPVLAISLAPAAGTDIYGNKYPAGVTVGPTGGSRTTIGMNGLLTYSTPQIKMPTMNGAWSSTTGHATIQLDALGNLVISWKILTVGATADGTLVWAIGSLPTGYRPKFKRRLSVYTDVPAAAKGPAFELDPNGSVLCYGIGAAATRVELYVAAPIFL
jgi:Putative Ig domain